MDFHPNNPKKTIKRNKIELCMLLFRCSCTFHNVFSYFCTYPLSIMMWTARYTDNICHTHFSHNPKITQIFKAYKYVKEFGEGIDHICNEL